MNEKTKIEVVSTKLVKESEFNLKIERSSDVFKFVNNLIGDKDREHLIILCLSTKNTVNNVSTISIGSLNSSIVHPREVFKIAILSNSASIILAHNHPSGDTEPSEEDLNVTRRIAECGRILGIEVMDHVIVGFNNPFYYSFNDEKLI
ncbi:MAG: DNA repair protein RadC [Clostridium tyrobutyricum]|jgi:DNA repair protein RadC|uniref:JAB domain-containing protein n=1 Tax=Clostridium tyrobutyricum TaxID=1519 RepID=UPI0024310A94|nr:JAB domain-containing protein [Clostridium tyrobutyricum]MCH4200167.1 DNA repair protein RadC [Clostridium tyrobutyricum]MCH4259735.1 DNA repair protein RadC [Clostridium tyrobutyricum]